MNFLDTNEDSDFAKYFKALGYHYTWDGRMGTADSWHEIMDEHGLLVQIEMGPKLEDVLNSFCGTPTPGDHDFWYSCPKENQPRLNVLIEKIKTQRNLCPKQPLKTE